MEIYTKKYTGRGSNVIDLDMTNSEIYDWSYLLKNYIFTPDILSEISLYYPDLKTLDKDIVKYITIYQRDEAIVWYLEKEFLHDIDFKLLSRYQALPDEFMRMYSDKLDWTMISAHQKLSEDFMEDFSDNLDWDLLSLTQDFSEEFKEKHKKKINLDLLAIREKTKLSGEEFQKLL